MKLIQVLEAKYKHSYKPKQQKQDKWRTKHVLARIQEILKYVGDDNLVSFDTYSYKPPEMSFSVSNEVEDEYEEFTSQLENMGWEDEKDFAWIIAMGDDLPNAFSIFNPNMMFDENAMKIVFGVTGYNVYNEMDQEGWEDEDEDEDW